MRRYYLPAFALGIAVTLTLFWLMQIMVLNSASRLKASEPLKMIEFVRLTRDTEVKERKRALPEKPPPKKEPPPPQLKTEISQPDAATPRFDMPNLDFPAVSARIDGSLLGGLQMGMGRGGPSTDLIPIFRVPPQYPMRAAKRRIEGWVRVEFTIDKEGGVIDPIVVDSSPQGVFDRAAVKSVSRWKFKPKIIDGIAIEQRAVQMLEFKLTK